MFKRRIFVVLAIAAGCSIAAAGAQDTPRPLQGGVEQNRVMPPDGYPAYPVYPTPTMIPQPPRTAPKHPPKPLHGGVQAQQPAAQPTPPRRPLTGQVQAPPPGVLPNQFLGQWLVLGSRGKIDAQPQYQNGIQDIFTASNSQNWNIQGAPGGYAMSSTSGVSQVQVGNCTADTAYIRYQHQVGKTMAREAIVMQISPDGRSFQGMQRISIVKPGEMMPRATVQYNLVGRRQ
jgi:hypothetical protein